MLILCLCIFVRTGNLSRVQHHLLSHDSVYERQLPMMLR